ncbi:MAG: tetratricopeptide repeat protein, partial [Candidatus Alcyoniella australis]|nr:tetratricopeptide repeat protein [Candidatus Alcyoniella australis]
ELNTYKQLLELYDERGLQQRYHATLRTYIGRLVSLKHYDRVLRLYRAELERRPRDPDLYNEFLRFLENHKLYREQGDVYRRAVEKFSDPNWYHRLARWTIRHRSDAAFRELTGHVVGILGDAALDDYLSDFVSRPGARRFYEAEGRFFESMHLRALERFPFDLRFVRRLLRFYAERGFSSRYNDAQARTKYLELAARYAMLDKPIRAELMSRRAGRGLSYDLSDRDQLNPAEALWLADALAFDSHYEQSYAFYNALDMLYPNDIEIGARLASLGRSLDFSFYVQSPQLSRKTAEVYLKLAEVYPVDSVYPTAAGELLIEVGEPRRALQTWETLLNAAPGDAQRYLELATLYWDYYFFSNSAGVLLQARKRLDDPQLYGAQLAAVYESMGDRDRAVEEYVRMVLGDSAQSWQARERLAYLESAHNLAQRIDAAFRRQVQEAGDDHRPALRYGEYLRFRSRRDVLTAFYRSSLERYADPLFVEELTLYFQQQGLAGDLERALQRLVEVKGRDSDSLARLAAFYEYHDDSGRAKKLLREIAQQQPKGSAERAAALRGLADFYWRVQRPADAVTAYRTIVDETAADDPKAADAARLDLARNMLRATDYAQAEQVLWGLIERNPVDRRYFDALSNVYTAPGREDYEGLAKLYAFGIQSVGRSTMPAATKTMRTIELRRGLISALSKLGRFHEAVDQYIEIVNRRPLERSVVEEAFEYARDHGLAARMIDYYTNTSQTSHKDYRWNVVLASIHYQQRQFADAEKQLQAAISNEPHRPWLQIRLAEVYQQTEQWDLAAQRYRRASELEGGDPQYLQDIARMYFRAGRVDDAVLALEQTISGTKVSVEQRFAVVRQLDQWELHQQAVRQLSGALAALLADPYDYVLSPSEASLALEVLSFDRGRLGAFNEARRVIDRLDAEARKPRNFGRDRPRSSAKQLRNALCDSFAQRLRATAQAQARREVSNALDAEVETAFTGFALSAGGAKQLNERTDFVLRLARALGLPGLVERILVRRSQLMAPLTRGKSGDSYYSRALDDLIELYRSRGDSDGVLRTMRAKRRAGWSSYPETARSAYWAGNPMQERNLLGRWLCEMHNTGGRLQPSAAERRAFEINALDEQQLDELLDSKCAHAFYLNLLIERGDRLRAVGFLSDFVSRYQKPVWIDLKRAAIALYFKEVSPEAEQAFARVLDLPATIGRRSVSKPDRNVSLYGDDWFPIAALYGRYLERVDHSSGFVEFLQAYAESKPWNAGSYMAVGDALVELERPLEALPYYDLGLSLAQGDFTLIDRRAIALLLAGRREEALAGWRMMIPADCSHYALLSYMDALGRQGLWEDAFNVVEERIAASFDAIHSFDRFNTLQRVAHDQREVGMEARIEPFVRACIKRITPEIDLLQKLIESDLIGDGLRNELWRVLLAKVDDPESRSVWFRSEKLGSYLEFCVESKRLADGRWAIERLDALQPQRLEGNQHAEQSTRIYAVCGEPDQARQAVDQRIDKQPSRETYNWALRLWDSLGLEQEQERTRAAQLRFLYEGKLAGPEELLEFALIEGSLGKVDHAMSVIEGVIFSNSENASLLRQAAQISFELRAMNRCGELIERLDRLDPGDLQTLALKVRYLHRRSGLEDAHKVLLALLQRPDCELHVLELLDAGYLADLRKSGALSAEAAWLGELPDLPPWGEIYLARIQLERGEAAQAAARLEQASVEFPEVYYPLLARSQLASGNPGAARKALINALRYQPERKGLRVELLLLELAEKSDLAALWWLGQLRFELRVYPQSQPLFAPDPHQLANELAMFGLKPAKLDHAVPLIVELLARTGCPAHAAALARAYAAITDDRALSAELLQRARELLPEVEAATQMERGRLVITPGLLDQGGER